MDYSTEEINKVSELAGLLTPLSDIAVLMDIDEDILRRDVRDRANEVSKAYYKAKAQTALNLRKQEIELANVGSPLGVQLTAGYMITMDSDEDL
jgi:hypothetical protein